MRMLLNFNKEGFLKWKLNFAKDQPNWLAYAGQIASVDWKAAAFVANKMRQRSYNDWEGVLWLLPTIN